MPLHGEIVPCTTQRLEILPESRHPERLILPCPVIQPAKILGGEFPAFEVHVIRLSNTCAPAILLRRNHSRPFVQLAAIRDVLNRRQLTVIMPLPLGEIEHFPTVVGESGSERGNAPGSEGFVLGLVLVDRGVLAYRVRVEFDFSCRWKSSYPRRLNPRVRVVLR